MSNTLQDSHLKEVVLNYENIESIDNINSSQDMMEDKNDMFVSALDSPTDSGLETMDISTNDTEDGNKIPNSDTLEDLFLQVSLDSW